MKVLMVFLAVVTLGSCLMLGVLARRANKVTRVVRDAALLHARLDTYAKRKVNE